ncbi:hypothetical protein SERLA73DRAFT_44293, partial [Serpula lacrymans var. lacrymans S7.3]
RVMYQHSISLTELREATILINELEEEYKLLYYQHHVDRLHMVQPSIHSILHLAPGYFVKHFVRNTGTVANGPPICSLQWTTERTIGNLVQEICQPSNPYANLSQCGVHCAQIHSLNAIISNLKPDLPVIPRGGKDLGD